MLPNIPREQTQLVSLALLIIGLVSMFGPSPSPLYGVGIIAFSCWVLAMSESCLHSHVQLQMSSALEDLRKKQQAEIQDLLYFLRDSQITAQPFDSMDGAKRLCSKIGYPAMLVTAHHQIIVANDYMHKLLGWNAGELNGTAAYVINDPIVMSTIGEIMSRPENLSKRSMITKYVYKDIQGKKVFGQLDVHAIEPEGALEGFFVVFHPEKECMISREEIKKITGN